MDLPPPQQDEEDTTETLALTQSSAFSAALNPLHHYYPQPRQAGCETPQIDGCEHSDSATTSSDARPSNALNKEDDGSDEAAPAAAHGRGPPHPAWRQGTPFRSNHHPHPPQVLRRSDSFPEDTPPTRLLFTIQDSAAAQSNSDGSPFGSGDSSGQRLRCRGAAFGSRQPGPAYQHQYSDRARAAQARRQERRRLHAREEAAFYDAGDARREFERYQAIARCGSPARRIREYRALCEYPPGEDDRPLVAAATASQPAKGCLIIKPSQSIEQTTPVNCENTLNSAKKRRRGETRESVDGFTTPRSSPDRTSELHKPQKRALAQSSQGEKRVRFAPLSAAEFDADEPTHLLTPLPPKQAAQLEQQIKDKSRQAAAALSSSSSSLLRQMPHDPELHRQTLENDAILRQWEPQLANGDAENDDVADDDRQGSGSRRLSRQERRRRRSSGRFTLDMGHPSLLNGEDDEGGGFNEDDPVNYGQDETIETAFDDGDVFDDEDNQLDENPLQICDDDGANVHISTSPKGSETCDPGMNLEMHPDMQVAVSPIGTKISETWLQLLNDNLDATEIMDMPASHVWNDLAFISRRQQPAVDELWWMQTLSEHPWLRDACQTSFQTLLGTARYSYQSSTQSDHESLSFDMADANWQERCMAAAEQAWVQLELKSLQRLHEKLHVLTKELDDKLDALAQLEKSVSAAIISLPKRLRQTWVAQRSRKISELSKVIADGSEPGRLLELHQQAVSTLLCDFSDALAARATAFLAPCDIDEDDEGDMMIITSPIQSLEIRLFRGIEDSEYSIQLTKEDHELEMSRPWQIESSHIVADFYERFLMFIIDKAHGLDFCDREPLLQLTTTLGRLQLVAFDLMHVCHHYRIHLSSHQGEQVGHVLTVEVELGNGLRLHVFYDTTRTRCVRWCLPSEVQVMQNGQPRTSDLPPSVAFAARVEHVSACRFVLSDLCESLQSLSS